jgi:hypothetical protein
MKIEVLFDELKKITEGKDDVFTESGMVNLYGKMQYGFFPLGLGILTENNTIKDGFLTEEVEEGGVMVLGNDFGTVSYVYDVIKDSGEIGEINSKTIANIRKRGVKIDYKNTFFTNLYMGLRLDDGCFAGTTMTKRFCKEKPFKIKKEYYDLCLNFFVMQLELLKPRIVICLGHEVKNAVIEAFTIRDWKKTDSFLKLYSEKTYSLVIEGRNKMTLAVIPHPCDLRNFREIHAEKLNEILNSYKPLI